jgi:ABC-type lipoprotein export system ATPase subunit
MHTPDSGSALTSALTKSVYLQQDLVREFVDADSEQERFEAVSELVGAGRVTDLSLALERAKTAWSRATNSLTKDLEGDHARLRTIETQLSGLTRKEDETAPAAEAWAAWCERDRVLTRSATSYPPIESSDAPLVVDRAVKASRVERQQLERRLDALRELLQSVERTPGRDRGDDQVERLRSELGAAAARVEVARAALSHAQVLAAEQRRSQLDSHEARAEMRALAELALRHLGPACPVCGQEHDVENTRLRLEKMGAEDASVAAVDLPIVDVASAAGEVEASEVAHASLASELAAAEAADRERALRTAERGRRVHELGLEPLSDEDLPAMIQQSVKEAEAGIAELEEHAEHGEQLALEITRLAEATRGNELMQERERLAAMVEESQAVISSREQTGELAGLVLEGLRTAGSEVVAAQLERLEPLVQRIYATADPHPSFRVVRLLTKTARGRGKLNASIFDPNADRGSDSPSTILSSSQMNALAVSLFLALNFGVPSLPLQTVMLDDPLQSLDDVNLLGLIDLLRRAKDERQLLMSTHDIRFGQLLARKLRPIAEQQRSRVIELSAWDTNGPVVEQFDGPRDPLRLRIAA